MSIEIRSEDNIYAVYLVDKEEKKIYEAPDVMQVQAYKEAISKTIALEQ